jgi:hypothetical protein
MTIMMEVAILNRNIVVPVLNLRPDTLINQIVASKIHITDVMKRAVVYPIVKAWARL